MKPILDFYIDSGKRYMSAFAIGGEIAPGWITVANINQFKFTNSIKQKNITIRTANDLDLVHVMVTGTSGITETDVIPILNRIYEDVEKHIHVKEPFGKFRFYTGFFNHGILKFDEKPAEEMATVDLKSFLEQDTIKRLAEHPAFYRFTRRHSSLIWECRDNSHYSIGRFIGPMDGFYDLPIFSKW